jgi:hypothetical protein
VLTQVFKFGRTDLNLHLRYIRKDAPASGDTEFATQPMRQLYTFL